MKIIGTLDFGLVRFASRRVTSSCVLVWIRYLSVWFVNQNIPDLGMRCTDVYKPLYIHFLLLFTICVLLYKRVMEQRLEGSWLVSDDCLVLVRIVSKIQSEGR